MLGIIDQSVCWAVDHVLLDEGDLSLGSFGGI